MGRIPGHYEGDDDDLTPGHRAGGGLHQNLFDEGGKLRGNARFVPGDIDPDPLVVTEHIYVPVEARRKSREQEELENAIGEAITQLVILGVVKAQPHVAKLWREKVKPFASDVRERVTRRKHRVASMEIPVQEPAESTATEIDAAEPRPLMSTAEAQARMLAAIAARAFADEQMRLVDGSEIVGGDSTDSVREALSAMPSEMVAELVRRMVESPAMFEENSLAELASVLARSARRGTTLEKHLPAAEGSDTPDAPSQAY
ncbi:hypothetical protein [Microbacterium natoriense]